MSASWQLLALSLFTLCALRAAASNVLLSGAVVFQASEPGDYFGYSVTFATLSGENWLVASAPRAQSSGSDRIYTRPGTLYRCPPVDGANCTEMPLGQGNEYGSNLKIVMANGSLGGSMDATLGKGGVVVCNPSFKDYDTELLMPGVCYRINNIKNDSKGDVGYTRLKPSNDLEFDNHGNEELTERGYGMFGFSVHEMNATGPDLLIGGPGYFSGKGAVARHRLGSRIEPNVYGIADPLFQTCDYFGYAVTSGKFRNSTEEQYVGGAPRAADMLGMVVVFDYDARRQMGNSKVNNITILVKLTGEQIGEYFGSALAVADINGDGVEDLLVGAPLHKDKTGDEGKVYIYLTSNINGPAILDAKYDLSPKESLPNARFGTSIVSLGDIDKDGYGDIAIGAPYEDSETGAVYIYYGSSENPYLKYEKRLKALDINSNLKAFGFSFSRAEDIDNNLYNDFAVGAYLSGHVVMLRSSPVLRINSSVTTNLGKIPAFSESLLLKICVRPSELLQTNTDVEVTVNIDPLYNRGYITETFITGTKISKRNVTMIKNNISDECWTHQLSLKNSTKIYKPLEIELTYRILYPIQTNNASFCQNCPVLDFKRPKTSHYIYYDTGCQGHVCKTNFTLTANFTGVRSPFIIGSKNMSSIEMVVEVKNLLEPSYETNISIVYPSAILLRQKHKSCYKAKHNVTDLTKLICEAEGVLSKTTPSYSFSLHFDIDKVPWEIDQLQVNISVEGFGEETNPIDDKVSLLLKLLHIADISIKGRADQESLTFVSKKNDSSDLIYEDKTFEHIYTVVNNGPSPVLGLALKFMLPHSLNVDGRNITYLKIEAPTRYEQTLEEETGSRVEGDEETHISDKIRNDKSLTLDCSLPEVECQIINYNIKQMSAKSGVNIKFKITGLLKEHGPLLKRNRIRVVTSGAIQNQFLLDQDLPGKRAFVAKTETLLFGNVLPTEEVQNWIIIVAVICGILILVILCIILWKLGFFKRNKPPTGKEEETEKPDTADKVDTDPLCESSP